MMMMMNRDGGNGGGGAASTRWSSAQGFGLLEVLVNQ